jgi:hypothetical protein
VKTEKAHDERLRMKARFPVPIAHCLQPAQSPQ